MLDSLHSSCAMTRVPAAQNTGCEAYEGLGGPTQLIDCCLVGTFVSPNTAPACDETVRFTPFHFSLANNAIRANGSPEEIRTAQSGGGQVATANLVFSLPTGQYDVRLRPSCEKSAQGPYLVTIGVQVG